MRNEKSTQRWMAAAIVGVLCSCLIVAACGSDSEDEEVDDTENTSDESTGSPSSERPTTGLGALCDAECSATVCESWYADHPCGDQALGIPCIGTATGMYCSRACESDGDCSDTTVEMLCMLDCQAVGLVVNNKCWTADDYAFLRSSYREN
jgi:hypothetical protein